MAIVIATARLSPGATDTGDWSVDQSVPQMSLRNRCELVESVFSTDVFPALASFVRSSCTKECRDDAHRDEGPLVRVKIVRYSKAGRKNGIGTGKYLFGADERCGTTAFTLLTPERLAASSHPRSILQLTLLPKGRRNDRFSFGVAVAGFPPPKGVGGMMLCGNIDGLAELRGKIWKISPVDD